MTAIDSSSSFSLQENNNVSSDAKHINKKNPLPIITGAHNPKETSALLERLDEKVRLELEYLAVRLQEELLLDHENNMLSEGRHYNFSVNTKLNPNDDNNNDIYHLQQEQ
jgi:hypothetical protein